MQSRSRPSLTNFMSFALEVFSAMPLEVETEDSPIWYAATFKSEYIKFSVYFDVRDAFVGCDINELIDVASNKKVKLSTHCPLEGYLIKNKGYRGSLSEFKPKGIRLTYWKMDLLTYSKAMLNFFNKEINANA